MQADTVAKVVCSHWFLEPMTWMGVAGSYETQGKLTCTCGSKLGSYSWAGLQCSCGAWVQQAMMVQKGRVDVTRNPDYVEFAEPEPEPEPRAPELEPQPAAVVGTPLSDDDDDL